MALYKESKKKFDADPDFKKKSQDEVVNLQSGKESTINAWKAIVKRSETEFREIYQMLGIDKRLISMGESFYNPMLGPMVEELEARQIAVESNGAMVIDLEGQEVPLMVRKTDGGFGQDATDLAAIFYRQNCIHADWVVYVVDIGQEEHFKALEKAAVKIGWLTSEKKFDHMGFGVILGEDGKKFKTRSGETVKLRNLIDEATKRAQEGLSERTKKNEGTGTKISEENLHEASIILGTSAVK